MLATGYVQGAGVGPLVRFVPEHRTCWAAASTGSSVWAVDASGNVYVADTAEGAVKEIPVGCASSVCVTALGGGFYLPYGVAVDGSGNIYVVDSEPDGGIGLVNEIPFGCASSSCCEDVGRQRSHFCWRGDGRERQHLRRFDLWGV